MAKKTKALAYDNGIVVDVDAGPSRTWASSPGAYLAGRAAIDEADATASVCEQHWGVGRLRLLVPTELREKFDRQRYLFNQAIWHGSLDDVRQQSARMVKAWLALSEAARKAKAEPVHSEVWETTFSDGTVAALVRSSAEAHKVIADGRKVVVYTLDEVKTLLEGSRLVSVVKQSFPGATVERASVSPGDPLNAFSDSRRPIDEPFYDDELPW
jgi:hypothetical protein